MGIVSRIIVGLLVAASCAAQPALANPSASAYRQLGLTYRDQERYPEAIAALQKSVALEPQNLAGRVSLGWTLHKAGQGVAAEQALLQALSFNPFYVPALNALGIVYLVRGDLNGTVRCHTWAVMLQPQNEIAYYNLSLAFQRLQEYDAAAATATQAATLEPTNPHPLVALAIAQWSRGDRSLAQQSYQRAVAIDPRYTDATFLTYLDEAGFSPEQIQLSKQVLAAVGRG